MWGPGSEVTVWRAGPSEASLLCRWAPILSVPSGSHLLLHACVLISCEDPSRVGSGATPGTSLNRRADPSPSTSPFQGPAGQGSTRGLAGHQSVCTGRFLRFWVDRNLGGHGLTLHGDCEVNSVLSKDQGGCVWGKEDGSPGGSLQHETSASHSAEM